MLRLSKEELDRLEENYPGIVQSILGYEEAKLPACRRCGSENTAHVSCGLSGVRFGSQFSKTGRILLQRLRKILQLDGTAIQERTGRLILKESAWLVAQRRATSLTPITPMWLPEI